MSSCRLKGVIMPYEAGQNLPLCPILLLVLFCFPLLANMVQCDPSQLHTSNALAALGSVQCSSIASLTFAQSARSKGCHWASSHRGTLGGEGG